MTVYKNLFITTGTDLYTPLDERCQPGLSKSSPLHPKDNSIPGILMLVGAALGAMSIFGAAAYALGTGLF